MRLPGRILGHFSATAVLLAAILVGTSSAGLHTQEPLRSDETFTTGIELFTLSVVVRDRNGRLVSNLTREDFEVFDRGMPVPVVEFRSEPAPVSLAIVIDVSGSMNVSANVARARDAAYQLLGRLGTPGDEVALFTFDTALREVRPFAAPTSAMLEGLLSGLDPFGTTSLRDAIAAVAERVTARGGQHRAVVVLTDGVDTSSRMTAVEVSTAASAIDVPVYILLTVSHLDHPGDRFGADGVFLGPSGELSDLARWTGGALLAASRPAHLARAAREIVDEVRGHYALAVEPAEGDGWHPLVVRTRNKDLTVRARSGYVVAPEVSDR